VKLRVSARGILAKASEVSCICTIRAEIAYTDIEIATFFFCPHSQQNFGNVLKGRPQAKRLTNVKKSPSPLMGEGWGEGEKIDVCQSVISPSP